MNTSDLSHGAHDLEGRCWDGQQWAYPVLVEINVDQVPVVTIASPEAMAAFKKAFVAKGSATNDARVTRVEVRIDVEEWKVGEDTQQWAFDIEVKDLKEGEHVPEVRAYDGEQYSDTASVSFKATKKEESPAIGLMGAIGAVLVAVVVVYSRRMLIWGEKGAS